MREFDITHKGIRIQGLGLGGIESYYILPGFHLAFDIGRAPQALIDIPRIFLSHGHLDHAFGLPYYFSQRSLKHMPLGTAYVPQPIVEPLREILKLWNKIEGFEYPIQVEGLNPGSEVKLTGNTFVRALKAEHRVEALGYALIRNVKKLKPEFEGLSGSELQKLRKDSVEISEEKETPLVVYSGDTTFEFVENHEEARKAEILILECTYIDDKRPIERARKWGHIHLDEIIRALHLFENDRIILTHLSRRYASSYVRKILAEKVPKEWADRIIFAG